MPPLQDMQAIRHLSLGADFVQTVPDGRKSSDRDGSSRDSPALMAHKSGSNGIKDEHSSKGSTASSESSHRKKAVRESCRHKGHTVKREAVVPRSKCSQRKEEEVEEYEVH